jgi:hypothetical protein
MIALTVDELKRRLPLPQLLHRLGLGDHAKPSCRSPFREEKNPSWGIFQREGKWYFKDHTTDDKGDEITIISRLKNWDSVSDFPKILEFYAELAGVSGNTMQSGVNQVPRWDLKTRVSVALENGSTMKRFRDLPIAGAVNFTKGSSEQMLALSQTRGIGLPGIILASERGLIQFGEHEGHECWGITDSTNRALELRRMDRGVFANGKKCKALPGSEKRPVGVLEAKPFPKVCITEGTPDFLECWHHVRWEGKENSVAVVCMLGAATNIEEQDFEFFKGKVCRLFPHTDKAGIEAAGRWRNSLRKAGARKVDIVDLFGKTQRTGEPAGDLLEFSNCLDPFLERLMP